LSAPSQKSQGSDKSHGNKACNQAYSIAVAPSSSRQNLMIWSFMTSSFNNQVCRSLWLFSTTAEPILRSKKHLEIFEIAINNYAA
jgi:hypothetical protein